MKPMLAHKYNGRNMTFPCFMQPKLNGIRALWLPDRGLLSRGAPTEEGHLWASAVLPHIFAELSSIPIPLDGELYCHGLSLQEINSRVAVKRTTKHDDVARISFNVFDTPMPLAFYKRLDYINDLTSFEHIKPVETIYVSSSAFGDKVHLLNISSGYEGSIYRDYSAHYGFSHACTNQENRWKCLLKRKDWLELDCTIIGFEEEHDINGFAKNTLGSFILHTPDRVEFKAGSGLTAFQREYYWPRCQALVGNVCKIKYEMLSDGRVPLKPSITFVDDGNLYVQAHNEHRLS